MAGTDSGASPNTGAADALIADLEDDGQIESVGQFTLDRERSREQLTEHRFENPETYVLELLQAVLRKGGERVEIDADADDFELWAPGVFFSEPDLDLLYEDLLAQAEDPGIQARRLLGRGIAASLALPVRYIDVRTGDRETRRRLLVRPDRPDRLESAPGPAEGTTIHVKLAFHLELGIRTSQNFDGTLPEEQLLRERAAYADAELRLEGERISHGMTLPRAVGTAPIRLEGVEGLVGFVAPQFGDTPVSSVLRYVEDGVVIAEEPLSQPVPVGLVAVVSSRRYRRDLSRTHIVQDPLWEETRTELAKQARSLLHDLLEWHRAQSLLEPDRPDWSRTVLQHAVVSPQSAWPALRRASLFPFLAANAPPKHFSLDRLQAWIDRKRRLAYVTLPRAKMAADPMRELVREGCLHLRDPRLLPPLQERLGVALTNRDGYVRSMLEQTEVPEISQLKAVIVTALLLVLVPLLIILLSR